MGWFSADDKGGGDLLKQGEEALANFEKEIAQLNSEKDSMMRRQVEIWSVSSNESNQGLEGEYKTAARCVALNVKKILCLEEHIKKIRLAQFHAKNGDMTAMKEVLAAGDPCVNITPEVPNIIYRPAPSMVLNYDAPDKQAQPPAGAAPASS